jgi:hypothetical protein
MFLSEWCCFYQNGVNFLRRLALQEKKKKLDNSSHLDVVEIARVPDVLPSLFPSWSAPKDLSAFRYIAVGLIQNWLANRTSSVIHANLC